MIDRSAQGLTEYRLATPRRIGATQRRGTGVRRVVRLVAGTPARLMTLTWVLFSAMYFLGPLTYDYPPTVYAWGFIGACLFAFFLGSRADAAMAGRAATRHSNTMGPQVSNQRIDLVATVCAVAGLIGVLSIATDKLFLSGLDYSEGITALRYERSNQALWGETGPARSPLVYLGYMTFAFSIVAYLLYRLKPEALSRRSVWLAHLGMASPVLMALLYGGRMPIIIFVVIVLGAIILNIFKGRRRHLQKRSAGRSILIVFVLLAVWYNGYIFADRRLRMGAGDYDIFNEYFQATSQTSMSPVARELVGRDYVPADWFMGTISTYFYLTHGFSVLERTLTSESRLGPYYGQYNLIIFFQVLTHLTGMTEITVRMNNEAYAADVHGLFSTAFGAMYLDFGIVGALAVLFLLGWLCQRIYREALTGQDVRKELLLSFVIPGIMMSPVHSIFAITVSMPILFAILVSNLFLRPPSVARRPRLLFGGTRRTPQIVTRSSYSAGDLAQARDKS
jgi:oligosaccharide repeat unit polymerase